EADGRRPGGVLHQEGVVDLRHVAGLELDVEHRADALEDGAELLRGGGGHRHPWSAAAPPTISAISCVIWACRCRLYVRRRTSRISPALSVAFFMAVRRAPCSAALVSTSPRYTWFRT